MYFVYILYSASRDKYYIGSSKDPQERLKKHNTDHSGFTGKTGDWVITWTEQHPSKTEGLKRERQIKGWKSRKMIQTLINKNDNAT